MLSRRVLLLTGFATLAGGCSGRARVSAQDGPAPDARPLHPNETPELRADLVYRFRVVVRDPDDALRQGMPVTVRLAEDATETAAKD